MKNVGEAESRLSRPNRFSRSWEVGEGPSLEVGDEVQLVGVKMKKDEVPASFGATTSFGHFPLRGISTREGLPRALRARCRIGAAGIAEAAGIPLDLEGVRP